MRPAVNFFAALPRDYFRHLSQWLNIKGARVELLDAWPSEAQMKAVTATALDEKGNPDAKRPDLSLYHLIRDCSEETDAIVYRIGFCASKNGNLVYATQDLDPKSSLLRYVQADLEHPEYSQLFPMDAKACTRKIYSQDPDLLGFMEAEIKAIQGLTHPKLINRLRLAGVCQDTHAWMNFYAHSNFQIFPNSIQQELLGHLLRHIAYAEEEEAVNIVKLNPAFLLSSHCAPVTSCAPEIEYLPISPFMLTVVQGDWFLYKRLVKILESSSLSEEHKAAYKADMLNQLELIEERGVSYHFDNLLNKGVQILNADRLDNNPLERKRYEDEVVKRNSYHLIIKTEEKKGTRLVTSCVLGFRDPETQGYSQYGIPEEHPLFKIADELYDKLQNANDGFGNRHEHYFTRAHRELALVKSVLKELGIESRWIESTKGQKFEALLAYLAHRIQNWDGWTDGRLREQWHGEIMAEARLFPAGVWEFWMSTKNLWSLDPGEIERFINQPGRRPLDKNFNQDPLFPLTFLGDRYYVGPARRSARCACGGCGAARPARLLIAILKVDQQERKNLKECLLADATLTSGNPLVL